MSRPANLGLTELSVEVNQQGSSNASVQIYVNPSFELSDRTPESTETVTLHLTLMELPSTGNGSQPLVLLHIGNETGGSLDVPLSNLTLSGLGAQQCNATLFQQQQKYMYIPMIVEFQSRDSHVPAGDYRYSIVANFTSSDPTIEDDIRDVDRDSNVDLVHTLNVVVRVREGE